MVLGAVGRCFNNFVTRTPTCRRGLLLPSCRCHHSPEPLRCSQVQQRQLPSPLDLLLLPPHGALCCLCCCSPAWQQLCAEQHEHVLLVGLEGVF